mmetsp:Transcript_10580/g.25947  ORF Transcript_10580/g.25947 Transcript_10580/m.25947 type:complete len:186 (+) Transcript_10580:102-659(+)
MLLVYTLRYCAIRVVGVRAVAMVVVVMETVMEWMVEGDGVAVLALGVLPSCAAQLALTFRGCSPLSCLRAGRSYVDYVARGSVRTPVTSRTSLEADQLQGVVQNIINLSAASCVAFLCSAAGLLPPVPLRKRYGAVDRGGDSDNNRRRSVERVYLVPNFLCHAFVLNFLEPSAVDVPDVGLRNVS